MRRTVGLVSALLGLVAAVAVTAATPVAAGGGTYAVTSGADSGPGTYREAIALASAHVGPSMITFTAGLTVNLTGTGINYTGTGPLTLQGQGATIDGTDSQDLLRAPSSAVTIIDLTFRDGDDAVEVTGTGGLSVTNSTFTSNVGSDGAAVEGSTGGVNVVDSTFTDNVASVDGGAVESGSGPISVTGSTFTGNSSTSTGGAVRTSGGNITVVDSTFIGNSSDEGGAIRTGSGTVTVTGSTFSGNDAVDGDGGAIQAGSATVVIRNSTFHDNTATSQGGMVRATGPLELTHVTGSASSAPEGVFVESSGGAGVLTSTNTVLTQPIGGGTVCSRDNAAVSGGHNRIADSSCGLSTGTDQQAGFFLLGPLADNGGPTRTRLPGTGLVDVIPTESCSLTVTTDQRGEGRPQGDGCDVGAVELDPDYQPDGQIRNSNQAAFVGNDVYNLTGAGQTRSQTKARGATATFVVRLQNDGATVDAIRLRGPGTSNRFTVRYKVGAANVTNAVVAGTYETPALQPGASKTVTVQITVRTAAPRGSTNAFTLTTRSDAVPARRDVVKASVRVG